MTREISDVMSMIVDLMSKSVLSSLYFLKSNQVCRAQTQTTQIFFVTIKKPNKINTTETQNKNEKNNHKII